MKNILIPTDFSKNAWNALKYALALFKDSPCTFYLLNAYTPVISGSRFMATAPMGSLGKNVAEKESEEALADLLCNLETNYPNPKHQFKTLCSFSVLLDAIKEAVAQHHIDLIVVGAKGTSNVQEVFIGSHTVKMARATVSCPLLVIPERADFRPPTQLVLATYGNRPYDLLELQPIMQMAHSFSSFVHIVQIASANVPLNEVRRYNEKFIEEHFTGIAYKVHTVNQSNTVSKKLELFAQEMGITMIFMLHNQHSYLSQLIREPVVKRAEFQLDIPLLLLPEMDRALINGSKKKEEILFSKGENDWHSKETLW